MILVFLLSALVAVPWAMWAGAVADRLPLQAASADMALHLIGAVLIRAFTDDLGAVPFYVVGGGLGTYLTVLWQKRHVSSS